MVRENVSVALRGFLKSIRAVLLFLVLDKQKAITILVW